MITVRSLVRCVSALLLAAAVACAQTNISGNVFDGAGGPLVGGNTYVVTGNLSIPAGQALTIQPGAVLKMNGNFEISVSGTLLCGSLAGAPVYITSGADDSVGVDITPTSTAYAPAQWSRIYFAPTSDASVFNNTFIRAAGSFGSPAVDLDQADIQLLSVTIHNCAGTALNLRSTSHPLVTGSAFNNCAFAVANVPFDAIPNFQSGNTATGNPSGDYLQITTGSMSSNLTILKAASLNNSAVFVLNASVTVPAGLTLALQQGVILKAAANINYTINGTLSSIGTPLEPIVFTGFADDSFGGDTNKNGPSAASPGTWNQIAFTANSDASNVDRTIIRYAGSFGAPAVNLDNANIFLTNSTIQNSSGPALNLSSNSFPTVANDIFSSCTFAVQNVPLDAMSGFNMNTATGNASGDYLQFTTSTVTTNLTLNPAASLNQNAVWVFQSNLTVASGATLTVPAGSVIKMNGNLTVTVNGTLFSQGTSSAPVVWTSFSDDTYGGDTNKNGASSGAPGSWNRILFNSASDASVLTFTRIRYGGSFGSPSIDLSQADIHMSDSIVELAAGPALNLASNSFPTIANNAFSSCTFAVQNVPLYAIGGFSSNTATGNASGDYLQLTTSAVTSNLTLNPASNLNQSGVWVFQSNLTVSPGVTLTVPAGSVIKMNGNLTVIVDGTLLSQGTASAPVVWTSFSDDVYGGDTNKNGASSGAPGSWSRILFNSASDASVLTFTRIRCAGSFGSPSIDLSQADIHMSDSIVEFAAGPAVNLASNSNPILANCTLSSTTFAIANVPITALAGLSGLSASGNASGDYLQITSTAFTGNLTLPIAATPNQTGVFVLNAGFSVASGSSLTLLPGTIIKVSGNFTHTFNGPLFAQGTPTAPIVFTTFTDDVFGGDTNKNGLSNGAPGYWSQINFNTGAAASVLDHVIVRYAGSFGAAAVNLSGTNPTIEDSIIENSAGHGIEFNNTSAPIVSRTIIRNNSGIALRSTPWAGLANLRDIQATGNAGGNFVYVTQSSISGAVEVYDYNVVNDVIVLASGSMTVPPGSALTIGRGIAIKMIGNLAWGVGGTLDLMGTGDRPIAFTTYADDAVGGDTNLNGPSGGAAGSWSQISYSNTSSGTVEHVLVRYAGSFGSPSFVLSSSLVKLDAVRVEFGAGPGFSLGAGSQSAENLIARSCGGDGLRLTAGTFDVVHATVTACGGFGIVRSGSFNGEVKNSIAWANTGGNFSGFAAGFVAHSNGSAAFAGSNGNINANPNFIDAANGDLRLQSSSPCLAAADFNVAQATEKDFDENSRILDHALSGVAAPDMGAYERAPFSLSVAGPPRTGQTITFTTTGTSGEIAVYIGGFLEFATFFSPYGMILAGDPNTLIVIGVDAANMPVTAQIPAIPFLEGFIFGAQAIVVPTSNTTLGAATNLYRGRIYN